MSDFVDADPFDPELAAAAEDVKYEDKVDKDTSLHKFLERRKTAYAAVFSTTACTPDDLEFVMLDLANFCRAYRPTFHPDNQKIQDLQEGRREVYQRIVDHTCLSHEALLIKYTDMLNKIG